MSLFTDTADLKTVISRINKNYPAEDLLVYVGQAEEKYIIPIIGQDLFDELNTAFAGTPSASEEALIKKLQLAIGYYAVLDAIPFLQVLIGKGGINEGNSQNSTQARQFAINNLMKACAENADLFLDKALEHLEKNKDDFPTWTASDEYTISKSSFINTTAEFQAKVNINNSRRAFLAIRPHITSVEEEYILPALGQDQYDMIKNHILDDSLSVEEKLLLEKIRRVVAFYAIWEAIPHLAISITGMGIKVLSENDGIRQIMAASATDIAQLQARYLAQAQKYQGEMKKYLFDNADLYPLYKDSDAYPEVDAPKTYEIPDNSESTSFRV